MASVQYNSYRYDIAVGNISHGSDTFKAMLVDGYTPNIDTHAKRSDVTGEVTGTGYTAGGAEITVTVGAVNTTSDTVTITFGGNDWENSTITADGAVIYKARGGASSADELCFYVDFGGEIISSDGTFSLEASTVTLGEGS